MCGITGIISLNATEISREKLGTMNHSLIHRGPDGEGYFLDKQENISIGLAHRRLSIIDISDASRQPLSYLDRYAIVHNGEIYNYEAIRSTLIKYNYKFQSGGDTEVIAAAYAHYGEACVDHFEGMFAFAIWDKVEKKLFCARDRFGEKPLYYYYNPDSGCFYFASEMKALFAAGIQKKTNMHMLHAYLALGITCFSNYPEQTFYEKILKLQSSHTLVYEPLKRMIYTERYWDLDKESTTTLNEKEAIERFNELYSNSVKLRTKSDVSYASTLSGGLDSSCIALLLSTTPNQHYSKKTLSAVFPGYIHNEQTKVQRITDNLALDSIFVQPTSAELIKEFESMMYYQEEPVNSSSVFAQFKVFETAKKNQIKVLIDGQGADETLAGYIKYTKWYLQEIVRKKGMKAANKESASYLKNQFLDQWSYREKFSSYFPEATKYFLESKVKKRLKNHTFLSSDFTKTFNLSDYIYKPAVRKLNDILYADVMINGLEELLRYADRNSMAHGCEVRLPFLDYKLVEFVFSLPSSFKYHNGWNKWILRNFADKKLPDEIVWQKGKIGFETPQELWMNDPGMIQMIMDGRNRMIENGICKKKLLTAPIQSASAHAQNNFEWRCLSASIFLK